MPVRIHHEVVQKKHLLKTCPGIRDAMCLHRRKKRICGIRKPFLHGGNRITRCRKLKIQIQKIGTDADKLAFIPQDIIWDTIQAKALSQYTGKPLVDAFLLVKPGNRITQ